MRHLFSSAFTLLLTCASTAQNSGLDWLRFVGGAGEDVAGFANGIDVTPAGDVWLAGADGDGPAADVQVTHLDAAGAMVSNWTFGGSGIDRANAIRVLGSQVHVAGRTESADFPTTPNAVQTVQAGGRDFFYVVLDATTGALLYASLLGGSGNEVVTALGFDPAGGTWLFGRTASADFPTTTAAYQTTLRGASDLALAHIDTARSGRAGLLYATFFGGDGNEPVANCSDLVVGNSGVLSFFADTDSPNLPVTANAWRATFQGGTSDALLARLDPRQIGTAQLVYGTYLGGNGSENGNAMWSEGDVFTVAGFTDSTDLSVTPNAPQPTRSGLYDVYLLQLEVGSVQLRFGTYLGGTRNDGANDLVVDAAGHVTITGTTGGSFPTTVGAFLPTLNPVPPSSAAAHGFVTRVDPVQGRLLYSTYIGTDNPFGQTFATSLHADGLGGGLVVGRTNAPNLPVTLGPPLHGTFDMWVGKLSLLPRGAARHGDSSWVTGSTRSFAGVSGMPRAGDPAFAVTSSGAPGSSRAGCGAPAGLVLVAAAPDAIGLPVLGATLHLGLPIVLLAPIGSGRISLPLSLSGIGPGGRAACQFAYFYPGCGLLQTSNAIEVVVQP